MLADMAVNDPEGFKGLCEAATKALSTASKPKAVENVVVLKTLPKSN